MSVLFSAISASISFFNYYLWASGMVPPDLQLLSIWLQTAFVLVTVFAVIVYQGKRTSLDFDHIPWRRWTLRMGVIIVSLVANASILAVLALHMLGMVSAL
jgi:hypothetical protein